MPSPSTRWLLALAVVSTALLLWAVTWWGQ